MDNRTRITEEIVPMMVQHGCFNNGNKRLAKIAECELTTGKTVGDNFTSQNVFVSISLAYEDEETPEKHHMLIKRPPEDPQLAKTMDTDVLYHNEALFYNQIISFMEEFVKKRGSLSIKTLFPKCYYAKCGGGCKEDIVVLQDMTLLGFRTAEERVFLDYDHCALSLRNLGRLHAVSYGMKHFENSEFRTMLDKLQIPRFSTFSDEDNDYFFKKVTDRAVDHYAKGANVDQTVVEKLRRKFEKGNHLLGELSTPEEPLAVMCHGDFCRNNILFRYESGKPCEVKFFDLQTVKYASPAIDLSFFFYLNTTAELRKRHFDDLFKEYHDSLINNLAQILRCPVRDLMENFSLEVFKKDFADHAIYGFLLCSFFLPDMIAEPGQQTNYDEVHNMSITELADMNLKVGGEEATRRVAEIIEDLVIRDAIK